MIKIAAPNMAQIVVDRAIQAFGGAGFNYDTPLPAFFAWARVCAQQAVCIWGIIMAC